METIQTHDPRKPVYKKPAFWIILVALLAIIVTAVCFLTMPKKEKPQSLSSDAEVTVWYDEWDDENGTPDGSETVSISAFPGVTFRRKDENWGDSILAEEGGRTRKLFSGMPVVNVYFADVTGDQKPELCATVLFGSGMVDSHIVVYDFVHRQSYALWDRGTFDYHLYMADGKLLVGKTPYMGDKQVDTGTLVMRDGTLEMYFDSTLCCQWQSDGAVVPLIRMLHESELVGEWLVDEERDGSDKLLYTRSLDLWKEYDFRDDGTMTYNETVPYSSDYEKAFGHPVSYPYTVYDGNVHIGSLDEGNYYGYGYLDETGKLHLVIEVGTNEYVYATLKRMAFIANDGVTFTALRNRCPEYFDLPTDKGLEIYVWQMAPDDYSFGLMAGTNLRKEDEQLWNLKGVSIDELFLILTTYDISPKNIEVIPIHMPYSSYWYEIDDAYTARVRAMLFTDAPQAEAAAELTQEQAEAFLNELSVEIEDGSPYGCDLVVFIDGFGRCLNVGDADAWKTASLRFEPKEERINPTYPHFTYAEILSVNNRDFYLDDLRISKSDNQFQKYELWDSEHPSADASIKVYVEPSMMERNNAVPERACVIKSFDAENRTVTVSFAPLDMSERDGDPITVGYDGIEEETHTFHVSDDTMLSLIDDYTTLVRPERFFRYLEQYAYMYLDYSDSDDRGIGFWIGVDGDMLLYLCEVNEE